MQSVGGDERRRSYRSALYLWALYREYGTTARMKVILTDLSVDGFKMRTTALLDTGQIIFLEVPGFAAQEARIAWAAKGEFGCRFSNKLHQAVVDHIARSCRDSVRPPIAASA